MRQRRPHRVTVQRFTASVSSNYDASGRTWTDLRTVWANMMPLSGFRGSLAGRDVSKVSHVCEMAYDPSDALRAADRLSYGSETYSINWIDNVHGLKREVRAFCQRIDS